MTDEKQPHPDFGYQIPSEEQEKFLQQIQMMKNTHDKQNGSPIEPISFGDYLTLMELMGKASRRIHKLFKFIDDAPSIVGAPGLVIHSEDGKYQYAVLRRNSDGTCTRCGERHDEKLPVESNKEQDGLGWPEFLTDATELFGNFLHEVQMMSPEERWKLSRSGVDVRTADDKVSYQDTITNTLDNLLSMINQTRNILADPDLRGI